MQVITANELKTKGVNSLEKALNQEDEVIISIRGKPRFVVMELEQYDRLREAEVFVGRKPVLIMQKEILKLLKMLETT